MPTRDQVINYAAQEAKANGLPASWFLAMLHQESINFDPEVVAGRRRSSAGAIGTGQLMPGTARGLGVDPFNWQQNIKGSARYLKQQIDSFGSIELGLSAYNSGPGGSEIKGHIEHFKETQNYVKKVTQLEMMYRQFNPQGAAGAPTATATATASVPPSPRLMPTTPAASQPYLSALLKIGPLSARVAGQAAKFEPRRPLAKQTQTQYDAAGQPMETPGLPMPDENDGWMGSYTLLKPLADLGINRGLRAVSEKRDRQNTKSGYRSDHWTGSKDSYAFDLSNSDRPSEEMDAAAADIVRQLGGTWDGKGELNFTTTVNGYRVQVLYRTQVGGNHDNHIHVGARRISTKRGGR